MQASPKPDPRNQSPGRQVFGVVPGRQGGNRLKPHVGSLAIGAIVAVAAPVLTYQTNSTLRQGVPMTDKLEFNLRAMLCRQLARREPENRVLWMAEAENWSRLSKKTGRGRGEEKIDASRLPCAVSSRDDPAARDVV